MKRGLVIGKFMPLPKGHIALIEFAAAQCDELIVSMSYTDADAVDPQLRFGWVKEQFSNNTAFVPEAARDILQSNELGKKEIIAIGKLQHQYIQEKLKTANKLLFCDTDAITTQIYSQHYLGKIPQEIYAMESSRVASIKICIFLNQMTLILPQPGTIFRSQSSALHKSISIVFGSPHAKSCVKVRDVTGRFYHFFFIKFALT
ncbi:MAG: adenylyltransferase/cytidyltransferase family protein [Agriterribacter sp.]